MRRIAITGGPFSGKTALAEALVRKGLICVPDAGFVVVEDLNRMHGLDGQRVFRKEHPSEFYRIVAEKQIRLETSRWNEAEKYIFLDRCLIDYLAEARLAGCDKLELFSEILKDYPIEAAFFCKALPGVDERLGTEKMQVFVEPDKLRSMVREGYTDTGVRVIDVPVMDVEQRAELVMKSLEF